MLFNHFIKVLVVVVVVVFQGICNGQDLPSADKTYLIQSWMDGGFVSPMANGKVCEALGPVNVAYGLNDPFPDRFKWQLHFNSAGESPFIAPMLQKESITLNTITMEEDYPPYCYPVYRLLDLKPIGDSNLFEIVSKSNGKCLTTMGSEVSILFWENCGKIGQNWAFLEI